MRADVAPQVETAERGQKKPIGIESFRPEVLFAGERQVEEWLVFQRIFPR